MNAVFSIRRILFVGFVLAAIAIFAVSPIASVLAALVSLPGSNFEIDDDANLKVDGATPPALDWANVTEVRDQDLPSGSADNSFVQGTKEDTAVPVIEFGSIPPNKSDLKFFGVYVEQNANGKFLNLYWTRVQDPTGTTNMDFEFNQSKTPTTNGVTPVRTPGDLLITYDLSKGGTHPVLSLRIWNGTVWGTPTDLTASGKATGSINTSAIPAADADGLATPPATQLDPRTFGEAQIDLKAIFDPSKCTSFGSAYLKSRSSDSFTAAMKDFIAPVPVNISNCGGVIIRKATDPTDTANPKTTFTYDHTIVTDPALPTTTFTLQDQGFFTNSNVVTGGPYTVTEQDPSALGYDLKDITCVSGAGYITPTIDTAARKITFSMVVDQKLDCTYTNKARGTIIIVKKTEGGDGAFTFTSGTLPDASFTITTTSSTGKQTYANLVPGTYDVAETVPTGWDKESATCDDGSDISSIGLSAGETVTCTFTDIKQGNIIIKKVTNPAGSAQAFTFTPSYNSGATFTLTDKSTNDSGLLMAKQDYTVSEGPVNGWKLDSATCSDGSPVSKIHVDPGETVTCTFTNSTGAILITKTTKNAAAGSTTPLAGVTFDVLDGQTVVATSGSTGADGKVCVGGLVVGKSYTVKEKTAPSGYDPALTQPQNITAAAGECTTPINGAPAPATFVNMPLSAFDIIFHSLAGPGMTHATSVVCTATTPVYNSGEKGPLEDAETASFTGLVPGTYTCTIVVDP